MSAIPGARNILQQQECQFRSAVSQSTLTRMGGSINAMLSQTVNFQWNANNIGSNSLSSAGSPHYGFDGIFRVEFDLTVIDTVLSVACPNGVSSGNAQLDIQYKLPGGTIASLFSTVPSIAAAAISFPTLAQSIYLGSSVPNTTAPVLSTNFLPAGTLVCCGMPDVFVTFSALAGYNASMQLVCIGA